jgi:molecular chaperone Hsp33
MMNTKNFADLSYSDSATPFLIHETNMRGALVRLDHALNEILTKHHYPDPVSRLLGEIIILSSMMGETLKFDGIITIQIKTDGPIEFLVADYVGGGKIRGYASMNHEKYAALDGKDDFASLIGEGYMAVTLDQGQDMERYQGIVTLEGDSISAIAEAYFRQSEQLQTLFNIKIGQQLKEGGMEWCGGGIMVQRLPSIIPAQYVEEIWGKTKIFLDTIHSDELIDPLLLPQTLLYRLFHEDGVWVYQPRPLEHRCRCSRMRVENILRGFSSDERKAMYVDGTVTVNCEFCNSAELFTEADFYDK